MGSIMYNNAFIYDLMNSVVNGEHNKVKYDLISKIVGKNKKVFEIGCGTCTIAKYLDKSCTYEGWDLNEKFINYAKKKGYNAKLKNIFDFKDYPKSDVILILDVLHHVVPNHIKLLNEAKKRCKKLIIIEPHEVFSVIPDFKKLNSLRGIKKKFFLILNKLFGDFDGINSNETVFKWNHDEKSLKDFLKKNNASLIKKIGPVMCAVFDNA